MPRQTTLWRARVSMALLEMDRVARHYDVNLAGCGCCGSPFCSVLGDDHLEGVVQQIELGRSYRFVNGQRVER